MFFLQVLLKSIEPKDALTILLAAISATIAIVNWRAGRFRIKLKDDLDILHRYHEEFGDDSVNDIRYQCLRDRIQYRMNKAYVLRGTDVSDLVGAAALIFSATITGLLTGGNSVWSIGLIVILITAGLGLIYTAFKDRGEERELLDKKAKREAT